MPTDALAVAGGATAPQRKAEGARPTLGVRALRVVDAHPVVTVLLLALLLRGLVAVALTLLSGGFLFLDDRTYSSLAAEAAAGERVGQPGDLYDDTATLLVPLTLLYRLFGPHVLLGQLLVAVFGAVAAAATARLALVALPSRWALAAGLVVAALPSQVLFSSIVVKDGAVWALLAGTALIVAALASARGPRLVLGLLGLAVLLVLLAHLRAHTTIVAAWAAALCCLLLPGPQRVARALGGAGLLLVVPVTQGLGPAGLPFVVDALAGLEDTRTRGAIGATALTDGSTLSVPRGLSALLVEPLPHQVDGNLRLLAAAAENVLWWPLLSLALVGVRLAARHRVVLLFPLLCGGATVCLYAVAESNFGTAYRHRGEIVWAVALLAAFGAHSLTTRRQRSST